MAVSAVLTVITLTTKQKSLKKKSKNEVLMNNSSYVLAIITGHGNKEEHLQNYSVSSFLEFKILLFLSDNNKGSYLRSRSLSLRFLAGVWCLMSLVLINYYNSLFISFLTVPQHEPLVNTFEDLARSAKLSLAVEKGSAIGELVLVLIDKTVFLKIIGVKYLLYYLFRQRILECLRSWEILCEEIPITSSQLQRPNN